MQQRSGFSSLDLNIGRARIGLSMVTLLSIYVDPTVGGAFGIGPTLLALLMFHLACSVAVYTASESDIAAGQLPAIWTVMDILFATAVAVLTEGPTSPSYAFFAFAIISAGCRFGFRVTILVTLCSVLVYLLTIESGHEVQKRFYMMRPAYLAIAGYLIAFLGERRANYEARIRQLELMAERERIARSLHDGYVQALAGMNLKLAACGELILRQRADDALQQLTELRRGVAREYDEVRSYLRTLVNLDQQPAQSGSFEFDTRFQIDISFAARGLIVDQIFQLVLEGVRNASRHGRAQSAKVAVSQGSGLVKIIIEDNGKGFTEGQSVPWAIASRVAEFGGQLTMRNAHEGGARLEIQMPANQ